MATKRSIKMMNLFVILLLLLSPALTGVTPVAAQERAGGVVELDGSLVSTGTASGASTLSFGHTSGTGDDRLMLVGVSWNSGSSAHLITTANFNDGSTDHALTVEITETVTATSGASGPRYAAILSLLAPPSGVAGTITINFDGSVQYGIVASAVNFQDVDQTTPLGTPVGNNGDSGSDPSLTLTGLDGDEMIFDTAFLGGSSDTYTLEADVSQTELWNEFNSYARSAGSIKQATSSSESMSWDAETENWWALAAVPINPVSAVSSVEASAIPTDAAPTVGDSIDVTINIDMSGMLAPDDHLGSFTASLSWDSAVLSYVSNSGILAGYTGAINPGSDYINFNGAQTVGASGSIDVFTVTFDVVGAGDAGLDLSFSAMAADTDENILGFLTIDDGSVIAEGLTAEVTVDGAVSSSTADDVSSISFSHTTGMGDDRLLLVGTSWNCGTTDRTINNVQFSYDTTDLTLDPVITEQAGTQYRYAAIYSLVDAPYNQAGTVTVTFSGSVSNGIVAGAINFKNVEISDPFETSDGDNANDDAPSVTLTGLDGDELVFDTVFQGASGETQTLTAGANQTEQWNGWIANVRGAASTEQATGSSVEMSWTADSGSYRAIVAVAINPAPLAPTCYALTLTHTGMGSDPVPTPANSMGCPIGEFVEGEDVTLAATPDSGWEIDSWSGTDGSSLNTLTMPDGAHAASVTYIEIPPLCYALTLTHTGMGSDPVPTPANSTGCSAGYFVEGEDITLTATPDSGWMIDSWTGTDGASLNTLTMPDGAHAASVIYTEIPPTCYVLTLTHTGMGSDPVPTPANSPGCSAGEFVESENITLAATPDSGWEIDSWTGTEGASLNTLTMPAGAHAASVVYAEIIPESVVATAIPSDGTPDVGDLITVTINIDMTNMDAPDNLLGSFTSSLSWNPAILSYVGNSGLLAGYTGAINPGSGLVQFNGAQATGVGGSIDVFTITFDVVGVGDAALNLGFTAIAADNGNSIMDHLTINQGSVVAEGVEGLVELISSSSGIGDDTDEISFAHTTGTGANRLMLVGISWNSGTDAENIESVIFSYDSTNLVLTEVITEQVTVSGTVSGPRFAAIYSLLNPPSGQAGTITITFDDAVSNGVVAGAATFKGVYQTVPLGTPVGDHSETSSDSGPSVTLSGLSGNELVFDNAFLGGQDDSYTLAVGADQTELWNDFDTNARGAASIELAASPVTMSWTPSTANWWAQVAVPINPALGGVTYYDLTIAVSPSGAGTTNPAVGIHVYEEGSVVDITASPVTGFEFDEWSGACTGSGTCQVTMTGNLSVTANFNPVTVPITFTGEELLGRPTDESISIKIVPDAAISYYYEYGTTSGVYTDTTIPLAASAGVPSTVLIDGLSANTEYFYRMQYSSDSGSSWLERDEQSFHTQRAEGSTFTFDITTDNHVNIVLGDAEIWEDTLNDVASDDPDFLIDLGDAFDIRSLSEGDETGAENSYKFQLPFFNIISGSTPIYLVAGNHEQQEAWHLDAVPIEDSLSVIGVNAQKMFFLNPVPDGSFYTGDESTLSAIDGDHLKEDYYSWEWGDALFVIISPFWYTETKPYVSDLGGGEDDWTGSGDSWDWTLGKDQFDWMKATLEGSDANYKFVIMHQMVLDGNFPGQTDYGHGGANFAHLYEWGGYNEDGTTWGWDTERPGWGDDPIHQILVNNNVSAVFHAHDHQYGYEILDGIVYQEVPSAGFDGGGFGQYVTGDGYTIMALENSGHLRVTVSPVETCVEYLMTGTTSSAYTYCFDPIDYTNYPPELDPIGSQVVNEGDELTFTATATDPNIPAQTMTFSLADGSSGEVPTGASITAGGAFSWVTTEEDGPYIYTFDVCVSDGEFDDCETIMVTVNEVNTAPVLDPVGNQSTDEEVELAFTATGSDSDLPAQTLTFSLQDGTGGSVPAGASITLGGAFSWTPTDEQSPGNYTFDVCISDSLLDDCETITVSVGEVDQPPVLDPIGNKSIDEETELVFTATASDPDLPPQGLTFGLQDGIGGTVPTGASITAGGDFCWTPTEAQGPGEYTFDVCVDDGELDDCETIIVTVNDVNLTPVLTAIGDKVVDEKTLLAFLVIADDPDLPTQSLTFYIADGAAGDVPDGAFMETNGAFGWIPNEDQGPVIYTFDVCVSDGFVSDCETILVTVNEVNEAPELDAIGDKEIEEGFELAFTATANDTDIPVQSLTFSLEDGMAGAVPTGASITTAGAFSWTPIAGQAPGVYTFDVCVSDGALDDCETISVTVNEYVPKVCYVLTISHTGNGSDPIPDIANSEGCGPGEYEPGETINLTDAIPDAGWFIASWFGTLDDSSTGDSNSLVMPEGDTEVGVIYKTNIYLPLYIYGGK